jgi:hypothetical protein
MFNAKFFAVYAHILLPPFLSLIDRCSTTRNCPGFIMSKSFAFRRSIHVSKSRFPVFIIMKKGGKRYRACRPDRPVKGRNGWSL